MGSRQRKPAFGRSKHPVDHGSYRILKSTIVSLDASIGMIAD